MASPKTLKEKDVSLTFHKMLVYEENAKYLPHRETPRGPHHFGTLIIILPVLLWMDVGGRDENDDDDDDSGVGYNDDGDTGAREIVVVLVMVSYNNLI